jgi:hypothetical protein
MLRLIHNHLILLHVLPLSTLGRRRSRGNVQELAPSVRVLAADRVAKVEVRLRVHATPCGQVLLVGEELPDASDATHRTRIVHPTDPLPLRLRLRPLPFPLLPVVVVLSPRLSLSLLLQPRRTKHGEATKK